MTLQELVDERRFCWHYPLHRRLLKAEGFTLPAEDRRAVELARMQAGYLYANEQSARAWFAQRFEGLVRWEPPPADLEDDFEGDPGGEDAVETYAEPALTPPVSISLPDQKSSQDDDDKSAVEDGDRTPKTSADGEQVSGQRLPAEPPPRPSEPLIAFV